MQQQITQRSRVGDFITGLGTSSSCQLCGTIQAIEKLKFSAAKDSLNQKFPYSENVIKSRMLNIRYEFMQMLPSIASTQSLKDFQSMCNELSIDPGLADTPLSDDYDAVSAKEIWEETISNDPKEDATITFKE